MAFLSWTAAVTHTDTPGSVLQPGSGVGVGGGGGVTHAAPPFSSRHLTYWCRGFQLEQTWCAVSQLQCLCLWAPGLLSWEQVTMSQRLFNSYTYAVKLQGLFSSWFYFYFPACSLLRIRHLTMLPSIPWKSFMLRLCKGLRKKVKWRAQWCLKNTSPREKAAQQLLGRFL